MTEPAVGEAPRPRAALAGNPSDGYGGAVLAVTLDELRRARRRRAAAPRLEIWPPSELVAATVARFAREHSELGARRPRSSGRRRSRAESGSAARARS